MFSYSATIATRLFLVCVALVYVSREEITGGVGVAGDDVSVQRRDPEKSELGRVTYLLANWSPQ